MSEQRPDATEPASYAAMLDDLGAASFPASDPPQSWTWDTPAPDVSEPARGEQDRSAGRA